MYASKKIEADEMASGGLKSPTASQVSRQAVWIASYPKSGNTWLRVFINNLMRELHDGVQTAQNINSLHEWSGRESRIKDFAHRLGKPPQDCTQSEIASVRPLVQEDLVRGCKRPVFIKTHSAVANIEGFPTINFGITRAAIYVVRNPLDVVISYAHHMGLSIEETIDCMADDESCTQLTDEKRVYEFMSSWRSHVASWISVPHCPVLIVRYEDMLASPERNFARIAAFLRLKPNQEQLQRAIKNSSFEQLAQQEANHGFKERPAQAQRFFRSGKADQWKDTLTRKQIETIIATHGPIMMRFGYLSENYGVD